MINTTSLCKDVSGYAGATPLAVYITDGRIDSVETLPNVETPRFFERARKALIHKWDGLTVAEARALHVDGASRRHVFIPERHSQYECRTRLRCKFSSDVCRPGL